MSTILKALRRLEEQKAASGSRPLREEVATALHTPEPPRGRRWLPAAVIAVGLGLAATVGIARWLDESSPANDVAAEPMAAPPEVVAIEPPARPLAPPPRERAAPSERQREAGLPEEAFSSPVAVVRRPAVEPRVPIEISRASDPLPDLSRGAAAPEKPKPAVPAEAKTPPAPKPAPGVAKPKPVVREPKPESTPTPKLAEKPPPATPEPEVVARPAASGTAVRVEKTLWHPKADRRVAFVAIGGEPTQRIQEGDVVGRYVVSEIQPSGVVFLQDGKPMLRAIGAK